MRILEERVTVAYEGRVFYRTKTASYFTWIQYNSGYNTFPIFPPPEMWEALENAYQELEEAKA